MLTVQVLKEKAEKLIFSAARPGCFHLDPSVKLRCITGNLLPEIKKGEIITATSVDENGQYSNTVHLKEHGLWWSVEHFELTLTVEDLQKTTNTNPCKSQGFFTLVPSVALECIFDEIPIQKGNIVIAEDLDRNGENPKVHLRHVAGWWDLFHFKLIG